MSRFWLLSHQICAEAFKKTTIRLSTQELKVRAEKISNEPIISYCFLTMHSNFCYKGLILKDKYSTMVTTCDKLIRLQKLYQFKEGKKVTSKLFLHSWKITSADDSNTSCVEFLTQII